MMRNQPALKQEQQIPAAWPRPVPGPVGLVVEAEESGATILALPTAVETPDAVMPSPAKAVPDVPVAVGKLIILAYAALIAVFFAFMAKSALAAFSIAISGLFVLIFMTIPTIFLRVEKDESRRPSFDLFLHDGIDTMTGRVKGADVLVQMLIVPILLTFGLAAMGIAGLIYIG